MPDIAFVYNEVYDSTNTSKSLLKALQLSQPGGVLWLNGDVVFDPDVLPGRCSEHIAVGTQLRRASTPSRSPRKRSSTPSTTTGYIRELSKKVVGGLGEAVGINYVSADDKATLVRRLADT